MWAAFLSRRPFRLTLELARGLAMEMLSRRTEPVSSLVLQIALSVSLVARTIRVQWGQGPVVVAIYLFEQPPVDHPFFYKAVSPEVHQTH